MSTLKLADRMGLDAEELSADEWVSVTPPAQVRSQPRAGGVVASIAAARYRYSAGIPAEVTLAPEDLASDTDAIGVEMAEYFDAVWDD